MYSANCEVHHGTTAALVQAIVRLGLRPLGARYNALPQHRWTLTSNVEDAWNHGRKYSETAPAVITYVVPKAD
jgi:hypothetical protein